jgi:hypothetical protein
MNKESLEKSTTTFGNSNDAVAIILSPYQKSKEKIVLAFFLLF